MNKKFTALLTAVSLVLPLCHVALADPAPTQPEVTVVGKRITGDDTYFEISLEVNRDYEEYSAVGVVLRYDPAYIVPAESWDEDAGELDLYTEGARTWGTRRALPTLGKDTWSTQTALAYEDDFLDLVSGTSKKWGYLYLGAEYPGTTPDDSSATASPGVATPSPTPTPTVDPSVTPDPDIYQNPVVAVRFMYKEDAATLAGGGDSAAARKATKEKLEQTWLDTAGNGANSWDGANWPNNEILTIASDDIAKTSPAQYPFAYYRADLEEYAYLHTWPSPAPTADPSGTPLPIDVQLNLVKEVGADVDPAHQLGDGDIEVCLGEGKSAKATGGLSLNDIYLILFYDWDDTLLGTLTAGVGLDMSADVSNYIESKFVHPELRSVNVDPTSSLDYTSIIDGATEIARKYSYRGEYEYDGPGTGNTFPDYLSDGSENPKAGSKYPITNKLDYTFAGKDLDPDHPFANGWAQVLAQPYDFDPDGDYAGDPDCDYLQSRPKLMSETWTALNWGFVQKLVDEFDSSGYFLNGLNYIDTETPFAVDFSNITSEQLECSDGNLYVKAMYNCGDLLDSDGNYYSSPGPVRYSALSAIDEGNAIYSITFPYVRATENGYGVTRAREPVVRTDLMPDGGWQTYVQPVTVQNGEKFDVQIVLSRGISSVEDYFLVDGYNANVASGSQISASVENWNPGFGPFYLDSWDYMYPSGYRVDCVLGMVVDFALADDINSLDYYALQEAQIKRAAEGTEFTRSTHLTTAIKRNITNFVLDAQADWIANHLDEPDNTVPIITYYQLQWAVLNSGAFLSPDAAEAACTDPTTGYSWCQ